jgi:glucosyl-3-phosphoglycerate synthase
MSGLTLDRHQEEATVELFSRVIVAAGDEFLNRPDESPFIHNWSRVTSAVPDIYEQILGAVEADNA